jgi:hypothetical protein
MDEWYDKAFQLYQYSTRLINRGCNQFAHLQPWHKDLALAITRCCCLPVRSFTKLLSDESNAAQADFPGNCVKRFALILPAAYHAKTEQYSPQTYSKLRVIGSSQLCPKEI